ncbi:hypothetical protein ABWL39_20390 [Chitinivorax sp. PXF-14]|uniref:hypothetical protein n=1 Tax=Chitinivorax sp. PXF-14 TaxID=3230488 RepID=UPI0034671753
MSREDIALGIAVANFVLTWGVALYMYLANKNKATNERIGKLEEDIEARFDVQSGQLHAYAERIQRLETTAESAPNHSDLAKVYEAVNGLSATVHQLVGESRGQTDTLRLILNQIAQKGMK